MWSNNYQKFAMRTNDGECSNRVEAKLDEFFREKSRQKLLGESVTEELCNPGELLNGALGLTGEAGEVSDMVKKYIFHGHDLDRDALVKEIGDVCWYVALLCTAIGVDLKSVMEKNIEKLKTRYPEGFSEEASINRVV